MSEFKQRLDNSNTERELLVALKDALIDHEMNEIGGPLYNGQGAELGYIAARRMMEIRNMTMRHRLCAWFKRIYTNQAGNFQ